MEGVCVCVQARSTAAVWDPEEEQTRRQTGRLTPVLGQECVEAQEGALCV